MEVWLWVKVLVVGGDWLGVLGGGNYGRGSVLEGDVQVANVGEGVHKGGWLSEGGCR